MTLARTFATLFALIWLVPAAAGQARVAVATNFLAPLRALAPDFEAATGHRLRVSSGSTGKLYAQIVNGAPFDLFLAANAREPERLEREGLVVPGGRFTYARGLLVLWGGDQPLAGGDGAKLLQAGDFYRLALANPKTAPYGAAAVAVLKGLRLYPAVRAKLVRGDNVGQAYQFVATGNAEFGFVAKSQVLSAKVPAATWWQVPDRLYPPIEQQAVLLQRGAGNPAARALVEYLQAPATRDRIAAFGYQPTPAADPGEG